MFNRLLILFCNRSLAGSIRLSQGVGVVLDSAGQSSAAAPGSGAINKAAKAAPARRMAGIPCLAINGQAVEPRLFEATLPPRCGNSAARADFIISLA
jgi:hypothetical protein